MMAAACLEKSFETKEMFSFHAPNGALVVDDEPLVRSFLQTVLQKKGFRVFTASNGQEALRTFQRHLSEIALVFMDVRMPGMDGPTALAALKQIDPDVRCCFITGFSADYSPDQLLQLGAEDVLAKPFNLAKLNAVLGQLFPLA